MASNTFLSHPTDKKVLSRLSSQIQARLLSTMNPRRCLAETSGDQLIGSYQRTLYDVVTFGTESTEAMTINCFYNKTCLVDQLINVGDGAFNFNIAQANLTADNLPRMWDCFGILKVLLLDDINSLADSFTEIVENLEFISKEFFQLQSAIIDEINEVIVAFENTTQNNSIQLISELQVQLNSTTSDLALQFEAILVNAFSIVIGKYLQQVGSDFLFFSNDIQGALTSVTQDINNNGKSLNNANETLILANIELLNSEFSNMTQAFIDEFNKYQPIKDNYTAIMSDLIQKQIVEKFNFSNDNITILVRNFLINIIQIKRNLFNETDDLFIAQYEKYKGLLNDSVTNGTVKMSSILDQFKASIEANTTNQSQNVVSIFTSSDSIDQLLSFNHSIDALGSLTSIADDAFQQALNDFQSDFIQFVNNLEQIIQVVNVSFNASYETIVTFWENLLEKAEADFKVNTSTIWVDLVKIKLLINNSRKKLANASYELSAEDQAQLSKFNLFEFGAAVIDPFDKLLVLKGLISKLIDDIKQGAQESNNKTLNFTGLNLTISSDIEKNLTVFVNKTSIQAILAHFSVDAWFYQAESFLGIQNNSVSSVNITQFLHDLAAFGKKEGELGLEIAKAVITNKHENITIANSTIVEAVKARFSQCSFDRYTFEENATETNSTEIKNLVNVSYKGFENNMTLKLVVHSILNGSYGGYEKDNVSAIYFELRPNTTVSTLMTDKLIETKLFEENVSVAVNGTSSIQNLLLVAFISNNESLIFAENLIVDEFSSLNLNITKSIKTIKFNTTLVCDHNSTKCTNKTTYGWNDPSVFEQYNVLPDQNITISLNKTVNLTALLN